MASNEKNSLEPLAGARKGKDFQAAKKDTPAVEEFIQSIKAHPFRFVGSVFILIIIFIMFVFITPAASELGQAQNMDLTFGFYNKTPITYVEGNYFYQEYQRLARDYQGNIDETNYQIILYQIWREAFEAAVVQTGILDEMKNAGFTAPDDVVDMTVAQLPDFQENGRFSQARYRQMDNSQRMTLWRQVRDSIAIQHFVNDISWLKSPSREGDFISSMASLQRTFDMAVFSISAYPDSEIVSYAGANPAMFRVTHLSRITVASEREARQILTSIQNGVETFEDAAKNRSRDSYAENSGDMGSRMVFELLSEIPDEQTREQVVNITGGSLSDVILIADNNWSIFRAEETMKAADTNDAAVMEKIRNYILTYERGRVEDYFISEAEQFTASVTAGDFDSAITDRGMAKQTFGPLPLNYGDAPFFNSVSSSGLAELNTAGTNDLFWRACFSTPLKTPSSPIVVGNNVVVIYPVDQTAADEEDADVIKSYYVYWLVQSFDQEIRSYFLNNGKLVDRFWEVFQNFLE